jgi:hypothetical protein
MKSVLSLESWSWEMEGGISCRILNINSRLRILMKKGGNYNEELGSKDSE